MAVVVVTDGWERAALAASRSLVARGHTVHVIAGRRPSLAGASRRVRQHRVAVSPLAQPLAFAEAVGATARAVGADVLLPITDASVSALLAHPACVPDTCRVPFPPYEAFRHASDKVALLPLAEAAGFGVPMSNVVYTRAEVRDVALEEGFTGILKPHRSVVRVGSHFRRFGVMRFRGAEECRRLLSGLPEQAFPVLVQQRIDGPGVGFFALRWEGQIRAAFAHRRLREIPPAGGVSVYREAIALDHDLAHAGSRLLEALAWEGVAMIECKREGSTGRHFIIEINARLWGSLQLAIDAGVDFPALLVEYALGRGPLPTPAYRVGVRSRWLWGELDHVYLRAKFRDSSESRAGALLRAATEVARWRRGDRCEVLRLSDPAPFVVETLRRLKVLR